MLCNWGQVKEFGRLKKLPTYLKTQNPVLLHSICMLAKKIKQIKPSIKRGTAVEVKYFKMCVYL